MTNADKIRSMTDEEMAGMIVHCNGDCVMCPVPSEMCNSFYERLSCEEIVVMWLKQEVSDNG